MSRDIFRIPMQSGGPVIQRMKVKSAATDYSTCRTLNEADAEGPTDILVANPYELDRAADDVIFAVRMVQGRGGTGVSSAPLWLDLNIQAEGGGSGGYSCAAATTANITTSGAQAVDGVTVTNGQQVLVWKQSTASQNGIYIYSGTGAWTKVVSFAAGDFTPIWVVAGTLYGETNFNVTAANTVKGADAYYK